MAIATTSLPACISFIASFVQLTVQQGQQRECNIWWRCTSALSLTGVLQAGCTGCCPALSCHQVHRLMFS